MKKNWIRPLVAAIAAAIAASGAVAMPGSAQNDGMLATSGNIIGEYGGANCSGGQTCVEKVGEEAEVSWQVQGSALVHSSDHIQTSEGFAIYVPDIVRDVTIELTHYPQVEQNNPLYYTATKQADVPINLPIVEDNGTGAEFSQVMEDGVDYPPLVTGVWKIPLDQDLSEPATNFAFFGLEESAVSASRAWSAYTMGLERVGVYTFTVKGKVTATSENTWVPIRAENKFFKCSQEGGGVGSYEEGCQLLKDYDWARTGELPPVSTADNAEQVNSFYEINDTPHGISGTGNCAPTVETGRFDTIASDTRTTIGSLRNYPTTFNNWANPAVEYRGSLGSPEDGCDEAAFHITICDKVEEGIPPLIEEPIVEPTPVQPGASEACVAAVGGIAGALLIALPLAVASQVEIPGLSAVVRDAQDRIARANSELQRNIGIYNEDLVRQANEFGIAMRPEHAQWLGAGAASVALFGVVAAMLAPCVPGDATGANPVMSAVPALSSGPAMSADPAMSASSSTPADPAALADPAAPADPATAAPTA